MRILLASVLALSACGSDDAAIPDAAIPDAAVPDATALTAMPIFVNRAGGTYQGGPTNDSRTNTTTIVSAAATLGPYTVTDERWADQLSRLRTMFAPFNVEIVDVDPGDVPHHEVVMVPASDWSQVINQSGVGGLSPFTCAPIANAITFVNPESFGTDDFNIAWTAAQGVGNAAGLDHAFSCPDVMTFLDSCGESKSFTDADVACGEFEARSCCSGAATQNSYQTLVSVFGAAP
jgi:hypothetical protein